MNSAIFYKFHKLKYIVLAASGPIFKTIEFSILYAFHISTYTRVFNLFVKYKITFIRGKN